jgi:AraC-like DNA-binding protein
MRTELVALGRFRCPPGDPLWDAENNIGDFPHIAFPHLPVRIALRKRQPVLTDPTIAVAYAPGQRFRREAVAPGGDECLFAVLDPELFEQIRPEPFHTLPASSFLGLHVLDDPLRLEELIAGMSGRPLPPPSRLAESLKALLAERFAEKLTLAELGREVGCSPYHLTRVFRRSTGVSIHRHRTQLRLRTALLRLREDVDLCSLGLDLGFASHSHFTEAFRSLFGAPPSAVRRMLSARFR